MTGTQGHAELAHPSSGARMVSVQEFDKPDGHMDGEGIYTTETS